MATIGIDLGTTNSLAAVWQDHQAMLIPNVFGEYLTPSVVSVDDNGEILVGKIAKERLITHPDATVSVFKRFMGTKQQYTLGVHAFSPVDLSAFVIGELKRDAEVFLGEPVHHAVISVPAYFNDAQRRATKQAAELAGLQVERLVSEPTAAALAHGLNEKGTDTSFLVFDLGGGTFDVSILEMFSGVFEVKAIAGDNDLGGEDFTNVLMADFLVSHQLQKDQLDAKAHARLYAEAERCKIGFGQNEGGRITLDLNGSVYEKAYTSADYEKLCTPLILRLRQPIERALRDADLEPDELDAAVLIGGATRMPMIRNILQKMLGIKPISHLDPDQTVAAGTAVQAALIERNEALDEVILTDVCPFTLGTDISKQKDNGEYEHGYFFPIIERNTPIPVSRSERLYTIRDNQTRLVVGVYQGESRLVQDNLRIGELTVSVPKGPAGEQAIDVRYTYDVNGILEVDVTIVKTEETKTALIEQRPGELSKEDVQKRLAELAGIKIHPRDRSENRLLLARGERLYEEMIGEGRQHVGELLHQFERALARQEENEVKKAAVLLEAQLESIERGMVME